jgi:hypothetical protein
MTSPCCLALEKALFPGPLFVVVAELIEVVLLNI